MSDLDVSQLLAKLDVNGTHSGDVIAAAYFRESAIAIRLLVGERDHYRQASRIDRSTASNLRRRVRELEDKLERALASQGGDDGDR
jgi:hypothetical protein